MPGALPPPIADDRPRSVARQPSIRLIAAAEPLGAAAGSSASHQHRRGPVVVSARPAAYSAASPRAPRRSSCRPGAPASTDACGSIDHRPAADDVEPAGVREQLVAAEAAGVHPGRERRFDTRFRPGLDQVPIRSRPGLDQVQIRCRSVASGFRPDRDRVGIGRDSHFRDLRRRGMLIFCQGRRVPRASADR